MTVKAQIVDTNGNVIASTIFFNASYGDVVEVEMPPKPQDITKIGDSK